MTLEIYAIYAIALQDAMLVCLAIMAMGFLWKRFIRKNK